MFQRVLTRNELLNSKCEQQIFQICQTDLGEECGCFDNSLFYAPQKAQSFVDQNNFLPRNIILNVKFILCVPFARKSNSF